MTTIKIDFPGIQTSLLTEELESIMGVIRNAKTYSMGPELKAMEEDWKSYLGVRYAVGVCNCTAALELATILTGIGPDDEVILPAHTFTASALPFLRVGARLKFADINPKTFVMSAKSVRSLMSSRTRVIVAVHLYGLMAPMDEIIQIAGEKNIDVIEDVAQAPGANILGRRSGTYGRFACFSFHSQKNITALGEGGLIVGNNLDDYEKLLGLRKIGSRPYRNQQKYWIPAMGNIVEAVQGRLPYNFALPEPNSAAVRCQLKRLDAINSRRNEQAAIIRSALQDIEELRFQNIPDGYISAYHLLVARCCPGGQFRDALIDRLYTKHGIKCVVQYNPLYNYELFQRNGYIERTCPESDRFFESMISFPFWSNMKDSEIETIVSATRESVMTLRKGSW